MPTVVVFPLVKLLQIHPEFSSIERKTRLILVEERLWKTTKQILVINWTTERILSGVWSFNETPEQIEYNEM